MSVTWKLLCGTWRRAEGTLDTDPTQGRFGAEVEEGAEGAPGVMRRELQIEHLRMEGDARGAAAGRGARCCGRVAGEGALKCSPWNLLAASVRIVSMRQPGQGAKWSSL